MLTRRNIQHIDILDALVAQAHLLVHIDLKRRLTAQPAEPAGRAGHDPELLV